MKLISVGSSPQVALSPPPTVTCDMVATLARWLDRDVQPLARTHLGAPIVRIDVMSSYSCRNAYGRAHGRVSEHGKADAVDIGSFVTARGQAAMVVAEWGPTARQIAAQAAAASRGWRTEKASRGPIASPRPSPGARTTRPRQPSIVPVQGGLAQHGRSVRGPAPPATAAAIMPLDLRPGMTIGIPGITLGCARRARPLALLVRPDAPEPPRRPQAAASRCRARRRRRAARPTSSAPPTAPPARCSTPCSAPKPTTPTSTTSTWTWPSAFSTRRFASDGRRRAG